MMFSKSCFVAAALALGLVMPARAALVQYDFNAAANNLTETGAGYAPSLVDPLVTASDIGNSNVTTTIELLTYGSRVLRVDPDGSSANLTAALTNSKYFTFTLTPDPNALLDLSSLTLEAARGGASTPRGFGLQTSVDGFGAANTVVSGPNNIATVRPTLSAFNIPLTDSEFQKLSSPITFRIYTYSTGDGATIEFENLTVNGIAYFVPEPSSAALCLLAGAGMLIRRRRATRS